MHCEGRLDEHIMVEILLAPARMGLSFTVSEGCFGFDDDDGTNLLEHYSIVL